MNWREKLWKTVSKLGGVPSKVAKKVDHLEGEEVKATSGTSAMEGMDREENIILQGLPKFSISAADILKSGFTNTGWTVTLQNIVGQPSLLSEEFLPFELLPDGVDQKLALIADGNNCDKIEVVNQIIQFYNDNEHEIMEYGNIFDAVCLYCENEVIA